MKILIKILFLALFAGILTACKPLPSVILQKETCSPPCWNGIVPGQTSLEEVTAKLKSIPAVDAKSIEAKSIIQTGDGIGFKFLPDFREDDGEIFSKMGTVETISFGFKRNTLKLSDVLLEWGQPDQYISIYYSEAEMPYLVTSIIYAKQGIILDNIRDMRAEENPKFDNNFPIQSVWFTNPTLTTALLQNGLINTLNNQDLLEGLKTWTGLGEIQYLTRSIWGVK